MSQNQQQPSFFSLAASVALVTTLGITLSLVDTASIVISLSDFQLSGIAVIALTMLVLLTLSLLCEQAFWREAAVRRRRLIGGSILAVIILALALLPSMYSIVLILLPLPMVAAFVTFYPGKPTYITSRFAAWCGGSCWTGMAVAFSYRLLSLPPPKPCQYVTRCYTFDARGFFFAVPFIWVIGLSLVVFLALIGVSLRLMTPVGGLRPTHGRSAHRGQPR